MKIVNAMRAATALALSTAALLAEQAPAQEVSLGFDVGLSMATFSVENIPGLDHKAGLAAGVSMAWRLDDLLSLETGASWVRKGATGDIPGSITGFDETKPSVRSRRLLETGWCRSDTTGSGASGRW